MLKSLHLLCGTTFFGLIIATFFYITYSFNKNDRSVINYAIKASYFADVAIFLCILILFITATSLVSAGNFTLAIPWIFVAYHAFGTIIILWLANLLIKFFYFSKTEIPPFSQKVFYLINIIMIFIFAIIIHDAITQSTWFDFLLRK